MGQGEGHHAGQGHVEPCITDAPGDLVRRLRQHGAGEAVDPQPLGLRRDDGGGVGGVEFQPQDEVGIDRDHDRRDHRDAESGGDLNREPAMGELDAALEADREEQIKRKNLGQRGRQLEVALDQRGEEPEQKKQDRRAEEVGEQLVEIHESTISGAAGP